MTDEHEDHPLEEDYPDAETLEEEIPTGVTDDHPTESEDEDW